MVKCVDDTLLWDNDIEGAFRHTFDYLTSCTRNGITFNPDKFMFAKLSIDFTGLTLTLTATSIKPCADILHAIEDFPAPQDITGARSWFSLVEQVAAWVYCIKPEMAPFRDLVENGVRSLYVDRPTCLATDWSRNGLGFLMLQHYCSCPLASAHNCCHEGWKVVFAGSCFTTSTESHYAPTEGEALTDAACSSSAAPHSS